MASEDGAPIRVDLGGPLKGRHLLVDVARTTVATVEGLESQRMAEVRAAVASVVVGGDLPPGEDPDDLNAALRQLHIPEFAEVVKAVSQAFTLGKASLVSSPDG